MRISDWSSDVCSSDLVAGRTRHMPLARPLERLAIGLCEIKQAIAGPTTRFLDAGAVGADEAAEDHAATRCASAAAMLSAHAEVHSSWVVVTPKPRRLHQRASAPLSPLARGPGQGPPHP